MTAELTRASLALLTNQTPESDPVPCGDCLCCAAAREGVRALLDDVEPTYTDLAVPGARHALSQVLAMLDGQT